MLDGNVCCVPRNVRGSGAPYGSEAGAAPAMLNCIDLRQKTVVIIIITVQLRFRLGRKQVVPYYPYMVQLKFLRSA